LQGGLSAISPVLESDNGTKAPTPTIAGRKGDMGGREVETMEKAKSIQSRGQEERKAEGKETQVKSASHGAMETPPVGSLHRGNSA